MKQCIAAEELPRAASPAPKGSRVTLMPEVRASCIGDCTGAALGWAMMFLRCTGTPLELRGDFQWNSAQKHFPKDGEYRRKELPSLSQ